MSNISKTVTDTTMGSTEVKYETAPGLWILVTHQNYQNGEYLNFYRLCGSRLI